MRRSSSICLLCRASAAVPWPHTTTLARGQGRLLTSSRASSRPATAAAAATQDDDGCNTPQPAKRRPRRTFTFDVDDLTDEERALRDSLRKEREAEAAKVSRADAQASREKAAQQQQKVKLEQQWAPKNNTDQGRRYGNFAPPASSWALSRQNQQSSSTSSQHGEDVLSAIQRQDSRLGSRERRAEANAIDSSHASGTLSQGLFNARAANTFAQDTQTQASSSFRRLQLGSDARSSQHRDGTSSPATRGPRQRRHGQDGDTIGDTQWRPSTIRERAANAENNQTSTNQEVHSDDVASKWQHVRRRSAESPPPPSHEVYRPHVAEATDGNRQQKTQSGERWRSDGKFVGFTAAAETSTSSRSSGQTSVNQPQFEWRTRDDRYGGKGDVTEDDARSSIPRYGQRDDRAGDRRRSQQAQKKGQKRRSWSDEDEDDIEAKKERARQRKLEKASRRSEEVSLTPILLPEYISIGNLATALRVRVEEFSSKLRDLGFENVNNDHVIDAETAGLIAAEFNYDPQLPTTEVVEDLVAQAPPDDTSFLLNRPPVITIMGHVDHGKTTLLDYLRKSAVAASEHGGITQHIGAFMVNMPSGHVITFLDTPGHAAFLSMRARGANVTDIVILVVAADDSVKPQTIEAIKHAKDARVPMIVAINKMDKPDADPSRVKQDLARHGVEVEDYGGETQTVLVSGKTGQGMAELEDAAIALADVLDVRADNLATTEGWVLEATRKAGGKVATVLVRTGTLRPGQVLVAGTTWTRVRSLRNEAGAVVAEAGPGVPVEVDGWREQPAAGAEALQAPDEQRARKVVDMRIEREAATRTANDVAAVNESRRAEEAKREAEAQAKALAESGREPAEDVDMETIDKGPRLVEVPLIVRADVSGSVEALTASLLALGNAEVRPKILRSEVGLLSDGDLDLAATANGHLVAFGVPVDGNIINNAAKAGVKVLDGSVIYRVVDDVKALLEEKLPPRVEKRVTGEADIAQEFEITLSGRRKLKVAGCRVRNGVMLKTASVRVLRGGIEVYDGTLSNLKNQKKDANEMRKGSECGMAFDNFAEFLPGDVVQCYETIREKRTL